MLNTLERSPVSTDGTETQAGKALVPLPVMPQMAWESPSVDEHNRHVHSTFQRPGFRSIIEAIMNEFPHSGRRLEGELSEGVRRLSSFLMGSMLAVFTALTALEGRSSGRVSRTRLGEGLGMLALAAQSLGVSQLAKKHIPQSDIRDATERKSAPLQSLHQKNTKRNTLSAREEVYGRSSGSARRLGAVAIEASTYAEIIHSPEAAQAKVEFNTSVQEGLGTDKELGWALEVRDFDRRLIHNGRIMTKDLKTAISDMTADGLTCARETAEKDPRFLPQVTRSMWDHQNALHVDAMGRGETPYNTIIVISPFPEEAAAKSGNEYWRNKGYVPHLRRGFVQVYHVEGNELLAGSLSFDGSNMTHLRELLRQHGVEVPPGEITDNMLKYPITCTLSQEAAKNLGVNIADQATAPEYKKNANTIDVTVQNKHIMERVFNESYVHICESLARGQQTEETRKLILQFANNAHSFNEHYTEALRRMRANVEFTTDDWAVMHELLVYSTIEMMRALYLKTKALERGEIYGSSDTLQITSALVESADSLVFQAMLGSFGADGAKNNRTYSACGLSISLGGEKERDPQGIFGGVENNEEGRGEGGACDYIHSGCYCCPYNYDGSSRGTPMKVLARREADGTAYCKRPGCGAWLSADGKRRDIGHIARKAQARKKQAEPAN